MLNGKPAILAADLEGVFVPEIWISVAQKTGIDGLRLTTRDLADYDELMRLRLSLLKKHKISLSDIQSVIETMEPLPGAVDFLTWVRTKMQFVILTDSYYQFVRPLLGKLGQPTVFAHTLEINQKDEVVGYRLRTNDSKRQAIEAFRSLGFHTFALGDSYNDSSMLLAADDGFFFRPPSNVVADFPQLPVVKNYKELQAKLMQKD